MAQNSGKTRDSLQTPLLKNADRLSTVYEITYLNDEFILQRVDFPVSFFAEAIGCKQLNISFSRCQETVH